MPLSTAELLDEIRNAQEAILKGGQAVTIFGSRQVTRADLKELREMERYYEKKLRRERGYQDGVNTADFGDV